MNKRYGNRQHQCHKVEVDFIECNLPVEQLCNKCYYCDRSEEECNAHPCRSFEREDGMNGYWRVKVLQRIEYDWKEESL